MTPGERWWNFTCSGQPPCRYPDLPRPHTNGDHRVVILEGHIVQRSTEKEVRHRPDNPVARPNTPRGGWLFICILLAAASGCIKHAETSLAESVTERVTASEIGTAEVHETTTTGVVTTDSVITTEDLLPDAGVVRRTTKRTHQVIAPTTQQLEGTLHEEQHQDFTLDAGFAFTAKSDSKPGVGLSCAAFSIPIALGVVVVVGLVLTFIVKRTFT